MICFIIFDAFGVSIVQSLLDMCLGPTGPMAKVQLSTALASIPATSWPKVCQYLVRSSIWALLGIYDFRTAQTLENRIKGFFCADYGLNEMQANVCSILRGIFPSIIADTLQGDGRFLFLGEVPREHRGLVRAASCLPGMER